MGAEAAGVGGVEEVAGIVRAHLEEDAELELAKHLVIEISVEVV